MSADRPLRIALVIERMDPSRGGRERSTAQVAARLTGRGHAVTILCQTGDEVGAGVAVHRLGWRGGLRATRLENFVSDVQRATRGLPYDIVHTMLPVPGANVYQPRGGTVPAQQEAGLRRRSPFGGMLARLTGRLNAHRQTMARLERQVANDPRTLCLPVSDMVREELERHYGRTDGVRVVYNGVEVPDPRDPRRAGWRRDRRRRIGAGDDTVVFLTAATNYKLKGVFELIRAFARLYAQRGGARDARLVILGGRDPEVARRWAGTWSVGDKVLAPGYAGDVFEWYAAADVVALLSWYDPCSRVVLEATRWGIPSVTTAFNGASEILAGGAGIVVPSPRNVYAVAEAMTALANPQRRREASAACRQVADDVSLDRHVDGLLAAYAEVSARPQT